MLNPTTTQSIIKAIVDHQSTIIGPLAFSQANEVDGITFDGNQIRLDQNKTNNTAVLSQLVQKYEELFGRASVEVCKEAVHEAAPDISPSDLPDILK